jgi:hypothetical protein
VIGEFRREGANLGYENFLSAKALATPPEPRYFLFSFHAFCWTTYKRRPLPVTSISVMLRQARWTNLGSENRGAGCSRDPAFVGRTLGESATNKPFSALGKALAEHAARVLVVEREA